MTTGKRVALGLALGLLVVGSVGGWAWSKRPRELPPVETVLPEFEQPSPWLDRAPSNLAFGIAIGAVKVEALLEILAARGLACDDTGVRAGIEKLRAYKRDELANADDPDSVSGASILYKRSKKETNPQVRLACEHAKLAALEPGRANVEGRALFVFDSPEHPLRHASLRRTYTDREAAMVDVREAIAHYQRTFGAPTSRRGTIPKAGEAPERPEQILFEWRYADLLVEVNSTSFGKLISVDERVEVPWPIRPDAPTLP